MTSSLEGEGGVWIPPKSDDVIYEQPLSSILKLKLTSKHLLEIYLSHLLIMSLSQMMLFLEILRS